MSPSFATLRRYAEATGTRLTVGLVPTDGRDGLTPTTIPPCAGFQAQGGQHRQRQSRIRVNWNESAFGMITCFLIVHTSY